MNKGWIGWLLKSSAFFHFISFLCIFFALTQATSGSIVNRLLYIYANKSWVVLFWSSTTISLLFLMFTFTLLFFLMDSAYRLILQCAWLISLIGTVSALIFHFFQMLIMPTLSELFIFQPTIGLLHHIQDWDFILNKMSGNFIPLCFAIAGLIFSGVMFCDRSFSFHLCWWSLIIWVLVLFGGLSYHWMEYKTFFWALILMIYIPWVWQISQVTQMREKSTKQACELDNSL